MIHDSIAVIRTRAELARRLATELKEPSAVAALLEIADTLEAEANKMEVPDNIVKLRPE